MVSQKKKKERNLDVEPVEGRIHFTEFQAELCLALTFFLTILFIVMWEEIAKISFPL